MPARRILATTLLILAVLWERQWRGPRRLVLAGALTVAALGGVIGAGAPGAVTSSTITIQAKELGGGPIAKFKFLINDDNTGDPSDPNPANHPGRHPTESNSPIVATGDQSSSTLALPAGRYLITVQGDDPVSPETPFDYKLWGKHITLPRDAGTVTVELKKHPLPLPQLVVHVFNDNRWVNSAPDLPGEEGLAGFRIEIEDQAGGDVIVDHFNNPLCGGECVTDANGDVTIRNLSPAWYNIFVTPPEGSGWIQTSTFDGGFAIGSGLEEGSDGNGAPLEAAVETNLNTAHWYGFVQQRDWSAPGSGTITGRARTWVEFPPFQDLTFGTPVPEPYVALSDTATDEQVWTGRGDEDGNFTVPSVPAGTYMVSIWDEQLQWIIRLFSVTVGADQQVDLGDVGVSRWYSWLSGVVYRDTNKNGTRQPNEPTIPGIDLDTRWRDGTVIQAAFTDPSGRYEFPEAEGGIVGKFVVGEVGFGRFGTTGAQLHDEFAQFGGPDTVTHVPDDLSGGLLTNQYLVEGHRSVVDWGKFNYAPGETGPIVGIVYHATTRNELDARFQLGEDYEPGIPDATVRLWGLGDDGEPNTLDDVLLNEAQADHWGHPSGCDIRGKTGALIPDPAGVAAPCIEVPSISNETKDGAFDGGFAFGEGCDTGDAILAGDDADGDGVVNDEDTDLFDSSGWTCEGPLPAADYVVQSVAPDHYRVVEEEDVNVNDGDQLEEPIPLIPPAECIGDSHTVNIASPDGEHALPDDYPAIGDAPPSTPADAIVNPTYALSELYNGAAGGSPYEGQQMPLCDKRLVELQPGQNPEANFFFAADNGLQTAGRIIGLVTDDVFFETDPASMWYGEARPIRDVPVGIRDYSGRLITTLKTDENGFYEVLLPSTQTANCPIPQGICPGMYLVVVNDPGSKASPNLTFNPNYLTAAVTFDVWPGKTTQADTPLDPISGTSCVLPAAIPELFTASRVNMATNAAGSARQIVLNGLNFGNAPGLLGRVQMTMGTNSRNLAINSWSNTQITATVPSDTRDPVTAGEYQVTVRGAGGGTAINGITLHMTNPALAVGNALNPRIVTVNPPLTLSATPIQNAIDAANPAESTLILVRPGTYRENVIMWKKVQLQGFGPGGVVGAPEGTGIEDPRSHVVGTVIDGRWFRENYPGSAWTTRINGLLPFEKSSMPVPGGADITVLAKSQSAFGQSFAARIDGFGLTSARAADPFSAGGIYVHAWARFLQLSNNIVEGNSGTSTGGIGLGQPFRGDNRNDNIRMVRNRMIGNGSFLDTGGGGAVGIHNGASNYEIDHNQICANFSIHYGGGISHFGQSTGGSIHDNFVYYNDAVDEGGGIQIAGEPTQNPVTNPLGSISGVVSIERNLIHSNSTQDDGGGIHLLDPLTSRVDIRNNMIVNNHAADLGGGMAVDDASNMVIVNNTFAYNVTTASSETTDGNAHAAGLVSENTSTPFLPVGGPFSNPVAFFNNIFWQNQAYTFDPSTNALTLDSIIDLEVYGTPTPQFFSPRFSILSVPYGTPHPSNRVGQDPNFLAPFINELEVQINRLSPAEVIVTLIRADEPQTLQGNYHINLGASAAVNGGSLFQSGILAPIVDYDGQLRIPPPDIGADERSLLPPVLP